MEKFAKKSFGKNPQSTFSSANATGMGIRGAAMGVETVAKNFFSPLSIATDQPDCPGMNSFTSPSNEPPPAYTPTRQAVTPINSLTTVSADGRYASLCGYNTIIIIDDSGSMEEHWEETREALETIAPICTKYDVDGIDIHFLNHPTSYRNVTSPTAVNDIFKSVPQSGATPTGLRLDRILRSHLWEYQTAPENAKPKPINIIVITDGEPSDDVETPIINAASNLDRHNAPSCQVGIQFFQVGKEPGAKEHLDKLDTGLKEISGDDNLRDIVDTVSFLGDEGTKLTGAGILKVVLGAMNRRLDREAKGIHH